MNKIIEVKRKNGEPSRIIIGEVLNKLNDFLPDKRVIIITDSNIHRRYREIIEQFDYIIIGLGETNKTLVTADRVYNKLIEMDADRHTFILGFGGGIVTDIAGFVASTYMRGVEFGFIASSLLAQVDASVGGKNGVNIQGYKNMVGVFNQPKFVLCDLNVLDTLPEREFRAGLAEMIKAGIIGDPALFKLFERHTLEEFQENTALLKEAIVRAIDVKGKIVEQDEFDLGERRKLNLGHTFAHAIEKTSSSYLHGEAVALGIAIISDLSNDLKLLHNSELKRIKNVVEKFGFEENNNIDYKSLFKALRHDKKRHSERLSLILPVEIGECEIRDIELEKLQEHLDCYAERQSKKSTENSLVV